MEERLIRDIIKAIGDDPTREGLKDTPLRVVKMYKQIFCGYDEAQFPNITTFKNNTKEIDCNGLLIDRGYYFSTCEHHLVSFFGDYYYGYIPNKLIVGASKIARVVDYFSARLQVQERLCSDVIDALEDALRPTGSILLMNGRHLCKEMRGVQKFNSSFETIVARGVFLSNVNGCKDEFLSRVAL